MITPIGNLQIRDDFSVTISGTVVAFRDDDEFLLQDGTGQVWVDSTASSLSLTNLSLGESVLVIGDKDDAEDFDARGIFQTFTAEPVAPPSDGSGAIGGEIPSPPMALPPLFDIGALQIRDDFLVTISGTVVAFRDDDEFLLQDNTGQVWVDSTASGLSLTNLSLGESILVVGDLDDAEDFDARQIFIQSDLNDPLTGDSLQVGEAIPAVDSLMTYPGTDGTPSQTYYPQGDESSVSYVDGFAASGYNPGGGVPLLIGFRSPESLGIADGQLSATGDLQPDLPLI